VRTFVALFLIGLLSFCPVLCGAAETDHGAHGHGASDGPSAPSHCPEDSDNCICQGAVIQSGDHHVSGHDAFGLPLHFIAIGHTPSHPIAHLTWDGFPTGLAGWGDALTVRALLQNFRC
jgi:hypothetical protein